MTVGFDSGVKAPTLTIRELRAGDIPEIARACFPDNPAEDIEERLRDELSAQERGRGVTLLALHGERVAGALTLQVHGCVGWIHNMAVASEFRGRRIAHQLLAHLCRGARERGLDRLALHVVRGNKAAIRAYERAGFRFADTDGMRGEQLRYEQRLRDDVPPDRPTAGRRFLPL